MKKNNIADNKRIWKIVKPFLTNKLTHKEKIKSSENGEILKTDMETAKILNTFFSNVVQNLNISIFPDSGPLA